MAPEPHIGARGCQSVPNERERDILHSRGARNDRFADSRDNLWWLFEGVRGWGEITPSYAPHKGGIQTINLLPLHLFNVRVTHRAQSTRYLKEDLYVHLGRVASGSPPHGSPYGEGGKGGIVTGEIWLFGIIYSRRFWCPPLALTSLYGGSRHPQKWGFRRGKGGGKGPDLSDSSKFLLYVSPSTCVCE